MLQATNNLLYITLATTQPANMKSFAVLAAALIAGVSANWNGTVVTTVTSDIYVTYCPVATTITTNGKTYTATAHQTLTITDCPCTYTKPVITPITPGPAPTSPVNTTAPIVWVTTTVSSFVTVCPAATTFTYNSKTYTATASQTITITDCPCTVSYTSKPATVTVSSYTTYCPAPTTIVTGGSTYVATTPGTLTIPVISTASSAASTAPLTIYPATTTAAATTVKTTPSATSQTQFTGAATKMGSAFGAVAGGLVAMLL